MTFFESSDMNFIVYTERYWKHIIQSKLVEHGMEMIKLM